MAMWKNTLKYGGLWIVNAFSFTGLRFFYQCRNPNSSGFLYSTKNGPYGFLKSKRHTRFSIPLLGVGFASILFGVALIGKWGQKCNDNWYYGRPKLSMGKDFSIWKMKPWLRRLVHSKFGRLSLLGILLHFLWRKSPQQIFWCFSQVILFSSVRIRCRSTCVFSLPIVSSWVANMLNSTLAQMGHFGFISAVIIGF